MGWTVQESNPFGGGGIFHTRPDRPCGHSASYTVDVGLFLRVKRPEHGVNHSPPSSAEVKEKVYLYSLLCASMAGYRVKLTFNFWIILYLPFSFLKKEKERRTAIRDADVYPVLRAVIHYLRIFCSDILDVCGGCYTGGILDTFTL